MLTISLLPHLPVMKHVTESPHILEFRGQTRSDHVVREGHDLYAVPCIDANMVLKLDDVQKAQDKSTRPDYTENNLKGDEVMHFVAIAQTHGYWITATFSSFFSTQPADALT